MMSEDDKLTLILMQVGETKGKVSGMADDLATIKGRMAGVVTRKECAGRHVQLEGGISRAVDGVRADLKQGLAEIKKQTGQGFQSITPAMLAAASAAPAHDMTPEEMEAALSARAEERAEKRRKLVSWYLGTAAAVIALLGTIGVGAYKMVTVVQRLETAVSEQPAAMKREISKVQSRVPEPRIVYVKVPVTVPDNPAPAPRRVPTKRRAAPPDR